MSYCSDCLKKGCCSGEVDRPPKDCPTLGKDPEALPAAYSEKERHTAKMAAIAEAESWKGKFTRVEDIMNYAHLCGYRILGVAFCSGFSSEAKILVSILRANGFTVHSAICKNGSIAKECLGVERHQKLRGAQFEPMCNPVGQAEALDRAGCEFNIVLGLCVGHDTLFFKHSQAPCTVLASKDRALGHNPIMALYTADSYYSRQYDFIKRKYQAVETEQEEKERQIGK